MTKIDPNKLKKLKRYSEIGARNSRTDARRIQDMHDTAVKLGASCSGGNVPGVLSTLETIETNIKIDKTKLARLRRHVEAEMATAEKIKLATKLLKQHGYSAAEAKAIAVFTFGKKKQ